MAWIEKLYQTYEACKGREPPGAALLMPISHTTQQAHIEIVIDEAGKFRRAAVVAKEDNTTLIPCTEKSGGRSGKKPTNYPLCDKLQYVAGDFTNFGGEVTSGFATDPAEPHHLYIASLSAWARSPFAHPKLSAVLAYVRHGQVVSDLVSNGILLIDTEGKLLTAWAGDRDATPAIFKVLSNDQVPEDAFVRWRVEQTSSPASGTWEDADLIESWIGYYGSQQSKRGLCMVTGREDVLSEQHPAKLRHGGDKAKIISSNDSSGYTYRGRLHDADEALSIGFDVTQKAHNALRWLIGRQAYRNGDQVIVSWAVAGKPIPDPFKNTLALILGNSENAKSESDVDASLAGDVGQSFALRFKQAMRGYRAKLDPTDDIVVMGLDSATPGRMAITYYRELKSSEFLDRVEGWHEQYAWAQNFGNHAEFFGAPAPRDIAEAAYGIRVDDKLRKATVERLIPCIIEGQPIPRDLVLSTARRAANRVGLLKTKRGGQVFEDEWEKLLGIACALFRGYSKSQGKEYQMALEEDRTTRDYLYGRLLALADSIEGYSLKLAGEGRDTTAARLMQRFADRPFATWRNIELALVPYKSRLRASEKGAGFLWKREKLLDEVQCRFQSEDFTSDRALSGEFLLGFHCQRAALLRGTEPAADDSQSTTE